MNYFVLASGGSTSSSVTVSDWSKLITDVTSQFSVANIVQVMSTIIVAGIFFGGVRVRLTGLLCLRFAGVAPAFNG
mgnify:CR=1 FL=1